MVLGSLVSAPYGICADRPALVGVGQVIDRIHRRGLDLVKVRPVKGLPFTKWYDAASLKPISLDEFLGGESERANA